jgi:uncharacterized protein (DUF1330 family)
MILSMALAAAASLACDNKPVLMIVSGPTYDRARMLAYGKAIADSGLYKRLGGYYVAAGRPIETFEGAPPPGYSTIVVRFPCLANARAFWNSAEYQEKIKPMRLNPPAGDYLVTVQAEVPLRDDMVGKVGESRYRATFDATQVEQVER